MSNSWSPWDLTPSGMGVVIAVALIIAMIITQWSKHPAPVASARSVAPTPAAIAECNRYAANRIGYRGLDDLDEARKSDERYRGAYASCMRLRGYAD